MKHSIFYLLIISTFIACNFSDAKKEFSNGIVYIIEGGQLNYIIKEDKKGFFLQPNVLDVRENEKYILIIQSINVGFLRENIKTDLMFRLKNNEINNAKIDSVISNNLFIKKQLMYEQSYWVLLKEKDSLLGPYENLKDMERFGFY